MASKKALRKAYKHSKYRVNMHEIMMMIRAFFPDLKPKKEKKSPEWSEYALEISRRAEIEFPNNSRHLAASAIAKGYVSTPGIFNIRWIGAYAKMIDTPSALIEALEYELSNRFLEVSFSVQKDTFPIGKAKVGLIVDIQNSSRLRYYKGDAFTYADEETGIRKPVVDQDKIIRRFSFFRYRDQIAPDGIPAFIEDKEYLEGTGILSFNGIVCSRRISNNMKEVVSKFASNNGWRIAWI